jgi:hypothetical protein
MNQNNLEEKIILHNFDFKKKEVFYLEDLNREILNSNKEKDNYDIVSLYEMQKSAANWNWYEFSWFEKKKKI